MLDSKTKNRFNVYMKRTDHGFMVKTVDLVSGVESLLKFTCDSLRNSSEVLENNSSTSDFRPTMDRFKKDNPYENKKIYSFLKNNPKINTKLNNLGPCLREIQSDIPGFNVYEDSSSMVDFQNANVIFVPNSKLAVDNIINLNIPGKLMNVNYSGILNNKGIIKYKAKTVIKPFTVIVGDYVIRINICNSLPSAKEIDGFNECGHDKGSRRLSDCCKDILEHSNEGSCTNNIETRAKSKTNDVNSSQFDTDDDTGITSDFSCNLIEDTVHGVNVNTGHGVNLNTVLSSFDNNMKVKELSSFGDSESNTSTMKCCTQTELTSDKTSSDESTLKAYVHTEECETKLVPSENCVESSEKSISRSKFSLPSRQSSECSFKTYAMHPYPSSSHMSQRVRSFESQRSSKHDDSPLNGCMSSSSNDMFSADDCDSKCKNLSGSPHFVGKIVINNDVSGDETLGNKVTNEFKSVLKCNTEDNEDKKQNNRCSSHISLTKIKKKLNETTKSLHELCSVIESIQNFTGNSISEENVMKYEKSYDKLNTNVNPNDTTRYLNSFTNLSGSLVENSYNRSDDENPNNVSNAYESNILENNKLQRKNNISEQSKCKNGICSKLDKGSDDVEKNGTLILKDDEGNLTCRCTIDSMQLHDVRKYLHEQKILNEINFASLSTSKRVDQNFPNRLHGTDRKFDCYNVRRAKSLTSLSDSNTSYFSSTNKKCLTPDNHSMKNFQSKFSPRVIIGKKYKKDLLMNELYITSKNSNEKDDTSRTIRSFSILSKLRVGREALKYNNNVPPIKNVKELNCETNSGKGSQESNTNMNSFSLNSIKTLYFKPDCCSSNNLSLSDQHSSVKIFKLVKDHQNEVGTYDVSPSKEKSLPEEELNRNSHKGFGKKIKQKISKWKQELWNCGASRNNSVAQNISNINGTSVGNKKQLMNVQTETEILSVSNINGGVENNMNQHKENESIVGTGNSSTSNSFKK